MSKQTAQTMVERRTGPAPQKLSTVAQTIAVLGFLAKMPSPMGVNPIARELDLPTSSCFRILKQLAEDGYAQFDRKSKCYSLGSGAVTLARRALDPTNTFSLIQPDLAYFVAETQMSVGFWRRIDRSRIVLAGFLESPHPMRIHMSVGQRLPLFIGAVGRAFASELNLTAEQLEDVFADLRWQAPPSLDEYSHQVAAYRRQGFAMDAGNFAPGVTSIATVLDDAMGQPGFGLSAIHLTNQIASRKVEQVGASLVALKARIHGKLYGHD